MDEINDGFEKIGFLILATSNKRNEWKGIKDSYLYNITFKSSFLSISKDKINDYVYYIGIDKNDRIFDNPEAKEELLRFKKIKNNIDIKFIIFDNNKIPKGHATLMWNELFKIAYDENCDYFYQCGDDIEFKTKDWIIDSIKTLKNHNDIGLTGPINNNNRILTQSFVSRKHMEIFGWYFPIEIKNWCCDDWYNMVYYPKYLYPLHNHLAVNLGGQPRYDINNDKNFTNNNMLFANNVNKLRQDTNKLANEHKKILEKYIKNNK